MNVLSMITMTLATAFLAALRSYIAANMDDAPLQHQSGKAPHDEYDFIVVGSGCAGSPVAARLSETSASVLLLEAGGSSLPETAVPAIAFPGGDGEDHWSYETKPQNNGAFGFHNNATKFHYGKMVGGTSSSDAMVFVRGNRRDYDLWARLGNTGWDYNSVLPYFNKLENFTEVNLPVDGGYHGFRGPVGLSRKPPNPLLNAFLEAGKELGYNNLDHSGPQHTGFFASYLAISNGVRSTASEGYITPVKDRPNLDVRTRATVQKVLFDVNKRAVGVQYKADGKVHTVRARKEVILSAGAFETPKLLMLSGIGPREHLREMKIPVVAVVEGVGRNYHDHPVVMLPLGTKKGTGVHPIQALFNLPLLGKYFKTRRGFFADPIGSDGVALLNVGGADGEAEWTDIILEAIAVSGATFGGRSAATGLNVKEEIYDDVYGPLEGRDTTTLLVLLARPKSRGSVTLRSTNPDDTPIIDPNLFSNEEDLHLMRKGIRMAFRIANTTSYKKDLQAEFSSRVLTPCRHHPCNSDAYWTCFCQYTALTGVHAAGTAKMAHHTDPMGVVSPRLSVRGVSGLRVVDASVMPEPVSANPLASIYLVGEVAADIIKQDWGYPTQSLD